MCTGRVHRRSAEGSQDPNQIPPDLLDAMEVYLGSEAPVQYTGLNPCGVVLLWTRR